MLYYKKEGVKNMKKDKKDKNRVIVDKETGITYFINEKEKVVAGIKKNTDVASVMWESYCDDVKDIEMFPNQIKIDSISAKTVCSDEDEFDVKKGMYIVRDKINRAEQAMIAKVRLNDILHTMQRDIKLRIKEFKNSAEYAFRCDENIEKLTGVRQPRRPMDMLEYYEFELDSLMKNVDLMIKSKRK